MRFSSNEKIPQSSFQATSVTIPSSSSSFWEHFYHKVSGSIPRWCHWNFSLTEPFLAALWPPGGRLSLWQKWVPGIFPERRTVRRADNLTAFMCWLSWNMGASTFWSPLSLSRPVMGLIYLTSCKLVPYKAVTLELWHEIHSQWLCLC
jgi:hypothetical protein